MKILETHHFQNYKLILTAIGQWPSQSPLQQRCIRCIIMLAIISILTPKMIKLCEAIYVVDFDIIIECIPMIGLHIGSIFKYSVWIINSNKIKKLFLHIEADGEALQTDHDIQIMQNYITRAHLITKAYATTMFSILVLYLSSPVVPKIMDIIKPLNTSRDLIFLYQTEYFVDQTEYYVPILIHAYMTVPITLAVILYFDNLLATYIHHACGMFMLLRIQLESLHLSINNEYTKSNKEDRVYKKLVECVEIHKNTIIFSDIIESWCTRAYMVILMINLFVITITGMVTVMKLDQPNEAIKFATFTLGAIFHLFYSSYQGQKLIEHSEMIFHAVYSSEWYKLSLNFQRLLIPIMMRSVNPCQITAGKISVISMDTFSLVLKNAMSFFTVLNSAK